MTAVVLSLMQPSAPLVPNVAQAGGPAASNTATCGWARSAIDLLHDNLFFAVDAATYCEFIAVGLAD